MHRACQGRKRVLRERMVRVAARRRSTAVAARRRSARVSRGPVTTIDARCRAQKGARHMLSEHTGSLAVSRSRRRVVTSECPRRLPAIVQARFRPTRHPVQTPARRCHGSVPSRRVDAVVSQPRSRPPSPQLDVAGTPSEGLPRRFRDTADDAVCSDKTCGAPSAAMHRPSIVVSGWRYTAAACRRAAATAAGAPASSHRGRTAVRDPD